MQQIPLLPTELQARLELIEQKITIYWQRKRYDHIVFQGSDYSKRICHKLTELIELLPSGLSSDEKFLVYALAWLYDIGMQSPNLGAIGINYQPGSTLSQEYLNLIRENKQLLSYDLIIESIANVSGSHINLGLFADNYTEAIAEICKHCSISSWKNLQEESVIPGNPGLIRPRLCAALLLLADQLYVDPNRVNTGNLKYANLNPEEKAYWTLFQYTQILPLKKGQIYFSYRLLEEEEMYLPYIRGFMESRFRYENNRVQHYLFNDFGLSLVPSIEPHISHPLIQVNVLDEETIQYLIDKVWPIFKPVPHVSKKEFPAFIPRRDMDEIPPDRGYKNSNIPGKGENRPTKNILFLNANPPDTDRLRLDMEIQTIDDVRWDSRYRDYINLIPQFTVGRNDIIKYLLRYKPAIVHFGGHGDRQGRIILEENGKAFPLTKKVITEIFSILKQEVLCVVLNACYSDDQAEEIANCINGCVVGMKTSIDDEIAVSFSKGFYQGICSNADLMLSFTLGKAQIDISQNRVSSHPIPKMFCSKNCNASGLRILG